MTQESFTIGALAKKAGVNVETIRFYQRRGLLDEPEKPLRGVRRYSERAARRVRFIKEAQKLGFSLDEIAELLSLEDGMRCREAREVTLRKLSVIRERINGKNSVRSGRELRPEYWRCFLPDHCRPARSSSAHKV